MTRADARRAAMLLFVLGALVPAIPEAAVPQPENLAALPFYLADRGRGIATSQFGTYVRPHELLVYTFYEYTRTTGFEYAPNDLGFAGSTDHFGTLTEREGLLFVSYGVTDRLEVELEGALRATASLQKASDDFSALPNRLEESGLGDVESQIRWRWSEEGERRPEMFSFLEVVFPLQRDNVLLGTQDWEYAVGFAAIKGHRWGTLTGRVSLSYSQADGQLEMGEYAVEYLKRLSPAWRLVAAIEGDQTDEVEAIVEGQVRLGPHVVLKLNSGFGVTKKAPDLAPEIGLLLTF